MIATTEAATVREAVVTVDGARIPYRMVGRGPVLVLIHGTGPGSVMWDDTIERYAERHTVLLPDLSGSVPAEDDGGPLTVERLAGQVAAVIEDAGRGLADVLGFSMGATVGLGLAALRPDLVRRLVPVAGWPDVEDEYLRNLLIVWARLAGDPEAFGRFAMITAFSPGFLDRIGREAVEASAGFMQPLPGTLRHIAYDAGLDLKPLLPRITAPTLVIGCTADATVPVANARRLHALIPHSSYREFDSGHVVLAERAEEFLQTVLEFFEV
ncbi:alpha/beta hydrolase [Catenulispora subtropica]|uniref:Alpha/beta hydrolase n=1 Tax=Catenulispora subtropica TaxID=450798 RepID=A0ABN2QUM0_9ACTN